jgi:hypothetical protein
MSATVSAAHPEGDGEGKDPGKNSSERNGDADPIDETAGVPGK